MTGRWWARPDPRSLFDCHVERYAMHLVYEIRAGSTEADRLGGRGTRNLGTLMAEVCHGVVTDQTIEELRTMAGWAPPGWRYAGGRAEGKPQHYESGERMHPADGAAAPEPCPHCYCLLCECADG